MLAGGGQLMSLDAKRALGLIDNMRLTVEALKGMPAVVPIAREIGVKCGGDWWGFGL